MPYPMNIVAVDVGGTKIAAAALTYKAEGQPPLIGLRRSVPTNSEDGGSKVLMRIVELIRSIIVDLGEPVCAIGVGTAGNVNVHTGSIADANEVIMPGWTGQPIRSTLESVFNVTAGVLNDVNAHALGELKWGAAKNMTDAIMVAPGTGVGGAIISNGQLVQGANGFAGAIEFTRQVSFDYGSIHSDLDMNIESVASGSGMEARFSERTGEIKSGAEISELAHRGAGVARDIIESGAYALGQCMALWASLLDPAAIIVGGSVTKAGSIWRDQLQKGFSDYCSVVCKETPIIDAALGSDAPLIGAAEYAKSLVDAQPS